MRQAPAVSFVLPCLNEAETLGGCLSQICELIARERLSAEIILADNGSTDGSLAIGQQFNVRIIHVAKRGYGAALIAGCRAATGDYIVMGDSDGSYDFNESMPMLALLDTHDLVLGSRFRGRILPGAMPFKNRYIGNPILTATLNLFFRSGLTDAHCGLRAVRRQAFEQMALRCTGMEFASEMVVRASVLNLRRTEVPVTLAPDGRSRAPHLNPWRDGWRHLRFLLLYSPRWLYLYPGLILLLGGVLLNSALNLIPESQFIRFGRIFLGTHWTIPATFAAVSGLQMLLLGLFTHLYAAEKGLYPLPHFMARYRSLFQLEAGLLLGGALLLLGLSIEGRILWRWLASSMGELASVRAGLFGLMWLLMGAVLIVNSFFLTLLLDDLPTSGADS